MRFAGRTSRCPMLCAARKTRLATWHMARGGWRYPVANIVSSGNRLPCPSKAILRGEAMI